MNRRHHSLACLLPLLCGGLAFVAMGVPVAHAAPLWTVDLLSDSFDLFGAGALCIESLGLSLLIDLSPHAGDGAEACGSLRGVGFAFLGLAAIVVIALGRMRLATEQKRLDVARRLVEQGIDPPSALLMGTARADLRRGLVLMFAGIGLFLAGGLTADRALFAGGLIPEFIGLGYLLSYWLASRGERPKVGS